MSQETNHFFASDFYKQYSDPYVAYKESISDLAKQRTPEIEFGRLCYEVFIMSQDGRKLWEIVKEEMLLKSHYDPRSKNPGTTAAYLEGYKAGLRALHQAAVQHQARIAQQEKTA